MKETGLAPEDPAMKTAAYPP